MSARTFAAFLFDGRTARADPVRLAIVGGDLVVTPEAGTSARVAPLARLSFSEPFERAPRMVRFDDGASLEVADSAGLTNALAGAGLHPGPVARLQRVWRAAVAALLLLMVALAAGYHYLLPAAARSIAFALPPKVEQRMGDGVLEMLDRAYLRPTTLSPDRQEAIRARLAEAAAHAAPEVQYRLVFRDASWPLRLNALSLPGGTIVLLDGLAEAPLDGDVVLAALGHELGHLANRHATRSVLQAAGLGAIAGLVWGDFSSQAANAPTVLFFLRYSRDFEREADAYAVRFLRQSGLSSRSLYRVLALFRWSAGPRGDVPSFLSTHPAPEERMTLLRAEPDFGGPEGRFGTVDLRQAIREVAEFRAATASREVEEETARRVREAADRLAERIGAETNEERRRELLSELQRRREEALRVHERLGGRKIEVVYGDLAEAEDRLVEATRQRMEGILADMRAAMGYEVIADKNALQGPASGDDLTADLVRRYDARYPAARSPAVCGPDETRRPGEGAR